jgi:putative DNA primase/helicase
MSHAAEVSAHLRRNRRIWLPQVFPNGRSGSRYFELGDAKGAKGNSLLVPWTPNKAGLRDFGNCWKGDDLGLLAEALGVDVGEAIRYAEDHFGAPRRPTYAPRARPGDRGAKPKPRPAAATAAPPSAPPSCPAETAPKPNGAADGGPVPIREPTAEEWRWQGRNPVATFTYHDELGRALYHVGRYESGATKKSGKAAKDYIPLSFDGRRWVHKRPGDPVLYNLPEVATHPAEGWLVFCEGEKKVDAARDLFEPDVWKLALTTWMGGPSQIPNQDFSAAAGRHVIVAADADDAGEAAALELAGRLAEAGALTVKIWLPPPEFRALRKGWDLADAAESLIPHGWDLDKIAYALQAAPTAAEVRLSRVPLLDAAAIEPKRTAWMWHPYLPANQISLIGARGGSGKGLVCTALAAVLTTGRPWPDGSAGPEPGRVLWCETEDPLPEVVVPRLIAAEADRSRVLFADRAAFEALDLRGLIEARGIRLVVLSPMLSFLKGLSDKNDEQAVRDALEHLQASIDGTGCAVVGICHVNKKADLSAIERLLGAVAFTNFVRSVLLAAPENTGDGSYRLAHAKHNLSTKGSDLIYRPHHVGEDRRDQFVRLEWEIADENADAEAIFDRKRPGAEREPSAAEWLVEYLTAHGESPREVVVAAGELQGFKEKTLEQAVRRDRRLGSRREGFPSRSWWRAT